MDRAERSNADWLNGSQADGHSRAVSHGDQPEHRESAERSPVTRTAAAAPDDRRARAPKGESKGGKSELRRAVRRVTPGQGNLKESGTENIPPSRSVAEAARAVVAAQVASGGG